MPSRASEIRFLPDSAFRSQAAGQADVIKSLAGRTRALYELASGENPFPNEPAATPRNPSGDLGWNLSGPPWGSAVLHPIAWMVGRSTSASVQGERQLVTLAPQQTTLIGPWHVYNRQHEVTTRPGWYAPYSRGYLRMFALISAAGSAALSLGFSVGDGYDPGRALAGTATITATSATAAAVTDGWFELGPGMNVLWLRLTNSDAAGGQDITITTMAVHQIVKRRHT